MVGAGASATVWRAHPRDHPRRAVAIKCLRRDAAVDVATLQDEADILAELDHLHVVRIVEIVEATDGPAIVMQYAAGGSLADLLASGRRLDPGELVAVAAPIASALASAHARGLVHGDVKPSNVLLTGDGQPLLADFGVARAAGRRPAPAAGFDGTDGYVAPETLAGLGIDARSDIYALGMLCTRALVDDGRVPPPLADVIARAVRDDPGARFLRAEDLAWALRRAIDPDEVRPPRPAARHQCASGGGVDGDTRRFGPRPPRPAAAPGKRRRWPRRLAAVGAAVVMTAVGFAAATRPVEPARAVECEPAAIASPSRLGARPIAGDADGDGCDDAGYWFVDAARSPSLVLVLRSTSYAVGRPGDVPVLGDWDCDGTDTLSLYRPATGEVYRFDTWPRSGPLETGAAVVDSRHATPRVEHEGPCDRLVLDASV
jgi:Protein kinase domain